MEAIFEKFVHDHDQEHYNVMLNKILFCFLFWE